MHETHKFGDRMRVILLACQGRNAALELLEDVISTVRGIPIFRKDRLTYTLRLSNLLLTILWDAGNCKRVGNSSSRSEVQVAGSCRIWFDNI